MIMRNRLRVLVQLYGDSRWHIGRVINARKRQIKITEGPFKNMILDPEITTAWRRTP